MERSESFWKNIKLKKYYLLKEGNKNYLISVDKKKLKIFYEIHELNNGTFLSAW